LPFTQLKHLLLASTYEEITPAGSKMPDEMKEKKWELLLPLY